jgi:HD-GYP domain-containing protein (c-di-GMP phosphodiesterase class II)
MKPTPAAQTLIAIDDLRVGVFVHLDMGWMSHPFPLSSFKISSADQIVTLRSLGTQHLRWSPELSDEPDAEPPPVPAAPAPLSAEAQALAAHRAALAAQQDSLQRCERQFSEATSAYQGIGDRVRLDPVLAGEQALALSDALLGKMAQEEELCIRLLNEGAGDKGSAHAVNVTIISLLMGRAFGLQEDDMRDLGVGALMHDVGKHGMAASDQHRDEVNPHHDPRAYEEHVARGVSQGRHMGLSAAALLVIAQHHEMADGSGFPLRLGSDRMSALARIVALVNRYDNLCNPSVPSRALTPHEAVSMLFATGSQKFDPPILNAFIKMMGVYPAGSVVQLTDDRYGMVVAANSSRPLKPRVLLHTSGVPRDEALVLDLETVPGLGIRRSLKPSALPVATLEYLQPRRSLAYFFEGARPLVATA